MATILDPSAQETMRLAQSAVLTVPLRWKGPLCHFFVKANDINLLEGQALVLTVRRACKEGVSCARLIIFNGSAVVCSCARKGPQSFQTPQVCHASAGLSLAGVQQSVRGLLDSDLVKG